MSFVLSKDTKSLKIFKEEVLFIFITQFLDGAARMKHKQRTHNWIMVQEGQLLVRVVDQLNLFTL